MIFPLFILAIAALGFLGYFARKGITWDNQHGSSGTLAMGLVVMGLFALIGWGLDVWFSWSIIPAYMASVGGSLQFIAYAFYAGFGFLVLSMLWSAQKCGTLVA